VRPAGHAGGDLPDDLDPDRDDEQQRLGGAGGADRAGHRRVDGGGRQAAADRGGIRRLHQLRHSHQLPDQHHGLHRRRLPLQRLREGGHAAQRDLLDRGDRADPALLPLLPMTALPPPPAKKLGLVIDLDTCVGCHACATSCKEWNAGGLMGPLVDEQPYGKEPSGVWFNRVHSYELAAEDADAAADPQPAMTLHFPRSCLHCDTPACVTVCPTGASYKRAEDGIVLVDEDKCIGCKLCSWACPYGAREYSQVDGVMKKCTLCVDRIYNDNLAPEDRVPACVQACPTRARHFGDLGD